MSYFPQGGVFDVGLHSGSGQPTETEQTAAAKASQAAAEAATRAATRAAADAAVAARLAHPTYNIWSEWFGKGAAAYSGEKKSFPIIPLVAVAGLGFLWWRSL